MIDKNAIREQFRRHERDTGSSEVQIATLTKRIEQLTEHLKANKKDNSSRYGLIRMVLPQAHQRGGLPQGGRRPRPAPLSAVLASPKGTPPGALFASHWCAQEIHEIHEIQEVPLRGDGQDLQPSLQASKLPIFLTSSILAVLPAGAGP